MARPQPRVFSPEEQAKYQEASAKQTEKTRTPLTVDEEKYPMFEIPINDKKLIYVPNLYHMEYDDELEMDVPVLNWDRAAYHTIRQRGAFVTYRCPGTIDGIEGFDGTCPFCDTSSENWELYNILYEDAGRKKGIDINSAEAKEGLKDERSDLLKSMAVSTKFISLTFPVFEFEIANEKTFEPATDENGNLKGTLKWYTIKESTYIDKWKKVLDATFEAGERCAAGRYFLLDYTYQVKNGKPTKMQSALALQVVYKSMVFSKDADKTAFYQSQAEYIDGLAQEWTPALAMSTIYNNMVYEPAQLAPIADEVMVPVRDKLAMLQTAKSQNSLPDNTSGSGDANSPENIAKNFGGTAMNGNQGVEEE